MGARERQAEQVRRRCRAMHRLYEGAHESAPISARDGISRSPNATLNSGCVPISHDHVEGDHTIDLCGVPFAGDASCGGIAGKYGIRLCEIRRHASRANAGFRVPSQADTSISNLADGVPGITRRMFRLASAQCTRRRNSIASASITSYVFTG